MVVGKTTPSGHPKRLRRATAEARAAFYTLRMRRSLLYTSRLQSLDNPSQLLEIFEPEPGPSLGNR
jgi:hypothetical protein